MGNSADSLTEFLRSSTIVFVKKIVISLVLLAFAFLSPTAYAQMPQAVLGATSEQLIMPPTIEGPGFLLPDSPFYFLDTIKQQVRLFFAATPDAKAQVYTAIAGERLAEMRVELQKGNIDAAETALQGVKANSKAAAKTIADAKFAGQDMSETAQLVNETFKRRLQLLDTVNAQATGEMKAELDAANVAITDAKMQVEDSLPPTLLKAEVQYDMNRDIARNLINTQDSAELLATEIVVLQKEASEAAALSLSNRQQAVNAAIADQQNALSTEERLQQQKQADQKLQLQGTFEQEVQTIIANAQKAATTYQTAQKSSN